MKIKTNSPTVLDLVIRILSQNSIAVKKLTGNELMVTADIAEGDLRVFLQDKLDDNNFDFDDDFVLVNGNSVWSYDRIIKEFEMIRKADTTTGISGYFYKFMHLNFTIAHGNMRGWMVEYPSFEKVLNLFKEISAGNGKQLPEWKTDVKKIITDIVAMTYPAKGKNTKSVKPNSNLKNALD